MSRPTKTRPRPAQVVDGAAEPLDEIESERLADDAANAIGAEVSASHGVRRPGGEREHAVGARAV